ncbi:hypothetical protein SAMD00023353_2300490 [Rosellinia necatrix]|uniref:Uncharacterized protein n=1 Tax=Rosellinia necatrix TaxID=77044 RepID=A0A1W2TGK0_ROSNE|nr:hypothetical protein SAMD00023353_2300490 [Rosellinia necatrix]
MPSKELLGDAIRTLTKKASRSLAPKKRLSDDGESHEADHHGEEGLLRPDTLDSERVSAPQPRPTPSPSNNTDGLTRPLSAPSFAAQDDANLSRTPSHNSEAPVTDSHILHLATASLPPVPEDAELPPLPKPVLIPRINPGGSTPFARAWAPELAAHAIAKEDFVAFVDNLNVIITPHAAFRVLEVTGFAVGLVPYDVAEGVGGAIEGIAILGALVMNYKRTKDYLALMNEKYFHPRKLHVKIAGTKRLRRLLGLDKKDPCLAPLTEETLELTSQERCLRYLSHYISELSFDVPAPSRATTVLARIATWEVKHKVLKADKAAVLGRKRSWKRHQKGKNPQTRWNSRAERTRVSALDWILVQNLEELEGQRAEKEAKKEERRQASAWHNIL